MLALDPNYPAEQATARTLMAAQIAPEEIADLMSKTLDWVYMALGLAAAERAPRRGNNRLGKERWSELLLRYAEGERAPALALEYGVATQSIHNAAHYRGMRFRSAYKVRK